MSCKNLAALNKLDSEYLGPMSCRDSGIPPLSSLIGTLIAGKPINDTKNLIMKNTTGIHQCIICYM